MLAHVAGLESAINNLYSESLFRTRRWPSEGFKTLNDARVLVKDFVQWYNTEHRHNRIKFVTVEQRHKGEDQAILANRSTLYTNARAMNLTHWSKEAGTGIMLAMWS